MSMYAFGMYHYNSACACEWCLNGGTNPNPLMVAQGGSYGYAEPHIPPGSRAPWSFATSSSLPFK